MAFRSVAQSDASSSSSGISITMPSGVVTGDYLLAFFVKDVGSGISVTPPSGWTLVDTVITSNGTFPKWAVLYEKISDGTEGASQSWTLLSNAQGSGTIAAWSGRKASSTRTFETQTANNSQNASPITLAAASGTAVLGDDLAYFVSIAKSAVEDWTLTAVSGFTVQIAVGTQVWATSQFATKDNVSAGAVGTVGGTDTVTGTGTAAWSTFVVAIAAATATARTPKFLRLPNGIKVF